MALIVCDKCGEEYSDRYKTCPFCAENEEYATRGRPSRSSSGRRLAKRKTPSILGPALILVLLALAALLVYFFLGDGLRNLLRHGAKDPVIVTVDEIILDLETDATAQLTASGAETYTWSSSDPTVATVSDSGLVTAVMPGKTTVSVTAKGAKEPAQCLVTVTDPPAEVVITLDQASLGLTAGTTGQLTASGAEHYVWSSNNIEIATVSESGLVTAVAEGSAVITVKDADSEAATSCLLTVVPKKEDTTVDPSKLIFKVDKYEMKDGQSANYVFDNGAFPAAKVYLTGTKLTPTWSVDNDSATVTENEDGSVTVRYKGSPAAVVTLTAKVGDQKVSLKLYFVK